jgi:protein-S-isoprenylcysteine O-methyltransferase Ste14
MTLACFGFTEIQQSRAYDWLMRLPMLGWASLLGMGSVGDLTRYVSTTDRTLPGAVYAINIAMRLSTIAFLMLLVTTTALRTRPTGRARGIEPRISAVVGTTIISALIFFPRRELSIAGEIASILLILTGNTLAVLVLGRLGRSFSVMAEARRLVTSGAYRIIRHPLYLAELTASFGVLLQFLSYWTALLFAVLIAVQLRRMRNEEVVLSESFPEYLAYKERTARVLPGIY